MARLRARPDGPQLASDHGRHLRHLISGANLAFVDRLDSLTSPQQSAIQPQQNSDRDFQEIQQLLRNEWLGRRDSNPDTQIQSSLKSPAAQSDEQVSSANQGGVG